jgi:hypothetical protein
VKENFKIRKCSSHSRAGDEAEKNSKFEYKEIEIIESE